MNTKYLPVKGKLLFSSITCIVLAAGIFISSCAGQTGTSGATETSGYIESIIALGDYYVTPVIKDFEITITLKKDSVLYTETGNMGKIYNQYLLAVTKIESNKIYLEYRQTLNGYTGAANTDQLFGTIEVEEGKKYFDSHYLKAKFGVVKVVLQK